MRQNSLYTPFLKTCFAFAYRYNPHSGYTSSGSSNQSGEAANVDDKTHMDPALIQCDPPNDDDVVLYDKAAEGFTLAECARRVAENYSTRCWADWNAREARIDELDKRAKKSRDKAGEAQTSFMKARRATNKCEHWLRNTQMVYDAACADLQNKSAALAEAVDKQERFTSKAPASQAVNHDTGKRKRSTTSDHGIVASKSCLLYTSPSPRDS